MAGFECSSQRRRDGVRLDLLRSTGHDRFALQDYRRCIELGLDTARDGLRWHRIEAVRGHFDWSSWTPMVEAAEEAGIGVVWDLFHFGFPDFYDLSNEDFPKRFADFSIAAAREHERVTGRPITACLLNEIGFFAWAVEDGYFPPLRNGGTGSVAKRQLVRCAVTAGRALDQECPGWDAHWAEPLIHVAPRSEQRREIEAARRRNESQFEVYDWLVGRSEPELGGYDGLVPRLGLNYYPHNQWYLDGPTIPMGHHAYRDVSDLLMDYWRRFERPLVIAETGAEGSSRPAWLHYICDEVRSAQQEGAAVEAICLYPVTAYAGWENSRHCDVGLFGVADAAGNRKVSQPVAAELARQQALFDRASP